MAISVTIQRPNLQDGDILDAAALTAITAVNVAVTGAVASDEFLAYKAQVTAALNAAVAALVLPPVGAVIPFAGFDSPTGWLPCDGRSLVRSEHPKLYAAIGIYWGSVDGEHFNLPDLRGRTLFGVDGSTGRTNVAATLGSIGGSQAVTLGLGDLPEHTHYVQSTTGITSSIGDHTHQLSKTATLTRTSGATAITRLQPMRSPTTILTVGPPPPAAIATVWRFPRGTPTRLVRARPTITSRPWRPSTG
jgi:microcystin-dependent protein